MATAGVPSGARSHHNTIFDSVFPPKQYTTATPQATPNIGTLESPGVAFGGFGIADDPATETRIFNNIWSTATAYLTLVPLRGARPGDPHYDLSGSRVSDAMAELLSYSAGRKQLLDWYKHEISKHFYQFVLPKLQFWKHPIELDKATEALKTTEEELAIAVKQYFTDKQFGVMRETASSGDVAKLQAVPLYESFDAFVGEARRYFHVLVLHSLPRHRIQKTMASYLFEAMNHSIMSSSDPEKCTDDDQCQCLVDFDQDFLKNLAVVGLGGSLGERALALAVHRLLQGPAVERRCFQVDWSGQSKVIPRLLDWVKGELVPKLNAAVCDLSGDWSLTLPSAQFESAAIVSFGRLRTLALFDYVSTWPASKGAVLDIKEYLHANGATEKAHVCTSFSNQIHQRLFHAGASTIEILSVYINVIHVFQLLDSRGVLLEKVAIPIRNYLRGREDTVSIIAASFLADFRAQDEKVWSSVDRDKICIAISEAIHNPDQEHRPERPDHDGDSDAYWSNMQWIPDPIDAGPDYKSTKADDIVAYIIGLFEPEDFIKAFSIALGQHLLKTEDRHYYMEISTIELLKDRLDSGLLQHAEVMLKDMQESANLNRRLNPSDVEIPSSVPPTPKELQRAIPDHGITLMSLYEQFKTRVDSAQFQASLKLVAHKRDDLYFPKRTRLPAERTRETTNAQDAKDQMDFEIKVLSEYFWPKLREGEFKVPQQIAAQRERYEREFSQRSAQRKLEWRTALDTTSIVLNLADREVEAMDVEVWKITIIDAFATERDSEDDLAPLEFDEEEGLSVAQLAEALKMSEDYVQNGISYWMNKRVLYEKSTGRYAVLEHLDMDVPSIAEPSQLDVEDAGAIMSEQAMLQSNASTFQTFIEQMLRNSGAKEIAGMMGITSVMKMVLPTFTYGDDEVKWLLEDMESRGDVVRKGESWAVAK